MLRFLGLDGFLSPESANAKFASSHPWGRWSVDALLATPLRFALSSRILTLYVFRLLLFGVVLFLRGNDRMLNDDRSFSAIP